VPHACWSVSSCCTLVSTDLAAKAAACGQGPAGPEISGCVCGETGAVVTVLQCSRCGRVCLLILGWCRPLLQIARACHRAQYLQGVKCGCLVQPFFLANCSSYCELLWHLCNYDVAIVVDNCQHNGSYEPQWPHHNCQLNDSLLVGHLILRLCLAKWMICLQSVLCACIWCATYAVRVYVTARGVRSCH
jgi:hypothetical protein